MSKSATTRGPRWAHEVVVTLKVSDDRQSSEKFGPFYSRDNAERCLANVAGHPLCLHAELRKVEDGMPLGAALTAAIDDAFDKDTSSKGPTVDQCMKVISALSDEVTALQEIIFGNQDGMNLPWSGAEMLKRWKTKKFGWSMDEQ